MIRLRPDAHECAHGVTGSTPNPLTQRQTWPELPILFVSGYADELLSNDDLRNLGAAFLEKPFTPAACSFEVDRLLRADASIASA